jgi:hypothetical protein
MQDRINLTRAGIQSVWSGGTDAECQSWFSEAAGRSGLSLNDFAQGAGAFMGYANLNNPEVGAVMSPQAAGMLIAGVPIYFNTGGAFFRNVDGDGPLAVMFMLPRWHVLKRTQMPLA